MGHLYHLMGGALWFNGWGSYDKVSCCFVWKYAQMLVFRGAPLPIITWPQVSVPLNKQEKGVYTLQTVNILYKYTQLGLTALEWSNLLMIDYCIQYSHSQKESGSTTALLRLQICEVSPSSNIWTMYSLIVWDSVYVSHTVPWIMNSNWVYVVL